MTQYELAQSLRDISSSLEFLAAQADDMVPVPDERRLTTTDILRGWGKLATMSFAPGYRDATLVLQMETGQRLEVCLSIQDSLFLHDELANMVRLAGSRPLDAQAQEGGA